MQKLYQKSQRTSLCYTHACQKPSIICGEESCQCSIHHMQCSKQIKINKFHAHLNKLDQGNYNLRILKTNLLQKITQWQKQINLIIESQIQNIYSFVQHYRNEDSRQLQQLMRNDYIKYTSESVQYFLNLKEIKSLNDHDYKLINVRINKCLCLVKQNLKKQLDFKVLTKSYRIDFNEKFKGQNVVLKCLNPDSIEFQFKSNNNHHEDLILPEILSQTTKLFIHAKNLEISAKKPYWVNVGIIDKVNLDFTRGNYHQSISVSTQQQLYGKIKKIKGNGIEQNTECLFELQYNKEQNYLSIKIDNNQYKAMNLVKSNYYVIIGMYTANSIIKVYE